MLMILMTAPSSAEAVAAAQSNNPILDGCTQNRKKETRENEKSNLYFLFAGLLSRLHKVLH